MYKSRAIYYFFIVLVAGGSFVLGWQANDRGYIGSAGVGVDRDRVGFEDSLEDKVDLDLYWEVWKLLDESYVNGDIIDEEAFVYGSIKGMVESLDDPYTVFMDPEESESFTSSLEGKLEGIGAELTIEGSSLVIVTPLRDSPAERAGLLPGDIIFLIEDEYASEMTMFEAIMLIRGDRGTTVNLTIVRESVNAPFEVSIVRDSIDIDSITVEDLEDGIKYLSVNQFNDKTNEAFGRAVSEMILDEPKGLIVDLRYNGGGYLEIAVELLSYLLPSNTDAVEIRQKGVEDDMMETNGNPKILNVPLVVLVNQGSASASEIVAGAIQDHGRGVIMGTTTFGKGTVQQVDSFADGSSIRITIAKWFTPDGRDINKMGLEPDVVVEISDEDLENAFDSQKESAAEYLRNL